MLCWLADGISFSFSPEEYTTEPISIQGIDGLHYRMDKLNMGYLVWIDWEQQIIYILSYHGNAEIAMRVAESIEITEGESK